MPKNMIKDLRAHRDINISMVNQGEAEDIDLGLLPAYSYDQLEQLQKHWVFDQDRLSLAYRILREKHLLILDGAPNIGKATVALKLAHALVDPTVPCRLAPPFLKRNRINPATMLAHAEPGAVLILRDLLQAGNTDLEDFLKQLDAHYVAHHLGPMLAEQNCYLILTASTSTLTPIRTQLEESGALFSWRAPDRSLFDSALAALLKDAETHAPLSPEREEELLAPATREMLYRHLKTVPKLARFLKEALPMWTSESCGLFEVLQRFGDHRRWLFEELPADFGLWSATLSLALLSFENEDAVGWSDFLALQHWLTPCLKAQFPYARKHLRHGFITSDRIMLKAMKAETVDRDMRPMIRFLDGSDFSAEIFNYLLEDGKRFLSPLMHKLRETVEEVLERVEVRESAETQEEDTQTLSSPKPILKPEDLSPFLSAKILGRLGRLYPHELVPAVIQRWSRGPYAARSLALGYFLQGVFAGRHLPYQQFCLDLVHEYEPENILENTTKKSGSTSSPDQAQSKEGKASEPAGNKQDATGSGGTAAPEGNQKSRNPTGDNGARDKSKSKEKKATPDQGTPQNKEKSRAGTTIDKSNLEDSNPIDQNPRNHRLSHTRLQREYKRIAFCTAYFLLADYQPDHAYQRIADLTLGHLVEQGKNARRLYHDLYQEATHTLNELDPTVLGETHTLERRLFDMMLETGEAKGPVTLLQGLRPYLQRREMPEQIHGRHMQLQTFDLLTLLLLLPDGLFEAWAPKAPDPRPWVRRSLSENPIPRSCLLEELNNNPQAVRRLAVFLNLMYEHIRDMNAGPTGRLLQKALVDHLCNWIVHAVQVPSRRESLLDLTTHLLGKACKDLRDDVKTMLTYHPYFEVDKRMKLHVFARMALEHQEMAAAV